MGTGAPEAKKFTRQIAFKVIPHSDGVMEDGQTKEEWKLTAETKKILDPKIKVTATCVRVPVFVGHSEAINIEFESPMSADEAREILRIKKRMNDLYVKYTGQSLDDIEKAMDRDTFLEADEAMKFGIVDKVFETRPESENGDAEGSGGAPE